MGFSAACLSRWGLRFDFNQRLLKMCSLVHDDPNKTIPCTIGRAAHSTLVQS